MTQRLLFTLSIAFALSSCTAIVDNNLQTAECLTDADCHQTNPCDGTPQCDGMTHTCGVKPGTAPDCNDGEDCTADSCDAASGACANTQIDVDHDGYSPGVCNTTAYLALGDDCDDSNNAVNPGVMEVCANGIDDNCNGVIDTDGVSNMITCYEDADGDGFHNPDVSVMAGCSCPTGYIQANALGFDCADGVAEAHPMQTNWYGSFFCRQGNKAQPAILVGSGYDCLAGWYRSYDYNCVSGDEEYNSGTPGTSCSFGWLVAAKLGSVISSSIVSSIIYQPPCNDTWDSNSGAITSPPACGASAYQWTCSGNTCGSTHSWVQQTCH